MDRIEISSPDIKGSGKLSLPLAAIPHLLGVVAQLARRLPKEAKPGETLEIEPGLVSVLLIDKREPSARGNSIVHQYGSKIVEEVSGLISRRKEAHANNTASQVYPGDDVNVETNRLLYEAKKNHMQAFLGDDAGKVELDCIDPEEILVPEVALPADILDVTATCSGAKVASAPSPQGDLFLKQEVDVIYYLHHPDIKELRYKGPLGLAWDVKPFGTKLTAKCKRERRDHKHATALEPPKIEALEIKG